jgi:hypothetical protein
MGVDDHDTFTGLTQLHAAAYEGNTAKVVELLDAGADMDIQAAGEVRTHPPPTPPTSFATAAFPTATSEPPAAPGRRTISPCV